MAWRSGWMDGVVFFDFLSILMTSMVGLVGWVGLVWSWQVPGTFGSIVYISFGSWILVGFASAFYLNQYYSLEQPDTVLKNMLTLPHRGKRDYTKSNCWQSRHLMFLYRPFSYQILQYSGHLLLLNDFIIARLGVYRCFECLRLQPAKEDLFFLINHLESSHIVVIVQSSIWWTSIAFYHE